MFLCFSDFFRVKNQNGWLAKNRNRWYTLSQHMKDKNIPGITLRESLFTSVFFIFNSRKLPAKIHEVGSENNVNLLKLMLIVHPRSQTLGAQLKRLRQISRVRKFLIF